MPLVVHGLRDLNRAFKDVDKDVRKGLRDDLKRVAEPVKTTAQGMAVSSIDRIGPKWSKMRVGVTSKVVYVAPVKRGVKGRGSGGSRRPNLAGLLMTRALEPALARHEGEIVHRMDAFLDGVADDFNRGGHTVG